MSNTKNTRSLSTISRDTGSIERDSKQPSWLNDFVTNLDKNAVRSTKDDASLFDTITRVVDKKSKHSTVAEAVQDLRERTGLDKYLSKQNKKEASISLKNIVKFIQADSELEVFKTPGVKEYIDNFIRDRRGNVSIPQVISKLHEVFGKDGISSELEDPELEKIISDIILKEKSTYHQQNSDYMNMGDSSDLRESVDLDPSNQDALHGCIPVKS